MNLKFEPTKLFLNYASSVPLNVTMQALFTDIQLETQNLEVVLNALVTTNCSLCENKIGHLKQEV